MQLGQAKQKAIQLMNEYSVNGSLISANMDLDYTVRMNNFADMAQKEIAQVKKIHASYSISQNPIPNQLGLLQGFDIKQFLPGTDYIISANGTKSYYFEVDKQCTVYAEEQINGVWTNLATITVPNTVVSFITFKGLLTPSNVSNVVRLRFTGSYPFNIRNTALFAYPFPDSASIPDYRPYVRYTMPADFMSLNKVVNETDERQYVDFGSYYWEDRRTIVLNYYYKGSFKVMYHKYPVDIPPADISNPTANDSVAFEIDEEAAQLIPYYLGGHAILDENQGIGTMLLNQYQQKLANLDSTNHVGIAYVENTAGW